MGKANGQFTIFSQSCTFPLQNEEKKRKNSKNLLTLPTFSIISLYFDNDLQYFPNIMILLTNDMRELKNS
jgi:hypothetical protein